MKNLKFLLIAFLTVSILFSCKKKDNTPALTVVGFWKGTYSAGSTKNMAALIRSNNTIRMYDLDAATDTSVIAASRKQEGTYTLSGKTFTANIAGDETVIFNGNVNDSYNNISGTYSYGTFQINKQ